MPCSATNNVEETDLWKAFKQDSCNKSRNELVTRYHSLARSIAAGVYARRPDNEVEFGDYLQYASVGLLEAVDRYDPGKGASFKTYASYRIKGSVLNGVQTDTEKRYQIQYSKRVNIKRLKSLKGSCGSSSEDIFSEIVDLTVGLAIGYMLEGSGLIHDTEDQNKNDPYNENVYDDLCNSVLHEVEHLSEKQRMVIQYHYFQYMTFDKIAELMMITKGRVSQIHKTAIHNIKQNVSHSNNLDAYY